MIQQTISSPKINIGKTKCIKDIATADTIQIENTEIKKMANCTYLEQTKATENRARNSRFAENEVEMKRFWNG